MHCSFAEMQIDGWIRKISLERMLLDCGTLRSELPVSFFFYFSSKNKNSCSLSCILALTRTLVDANLIFFFLSQFRSLTPWQQQPAAEPRYAPDRVSMKGQVLNNKQRTPLASSNRQLLFQLLHYALKMLTSASIWNSNGKALENAHFSLWFLCYRNREYKVQAWQPSFIF